VISLAQELRERLRHRAQTVGTHTALLELREAVDAAAKTTGSDPHTDFIAAIERQHEVEINELGGQHEAEIKKLTAEREEALDKAYAANHGVSAWGRE
jgi:hypothetical protein